MRRGSLASVATLLALAACARGPRAGIPPEWRLAARTTADTAPHAMVVSGHPLASRVGSEILAGGGNAADAAVAVGFALAVVLPDAGNIGGGGFLVYRSADAMVRTLDYRETAPGAAHRDMYLTAPSDSSSLIGHRAVGVPGSVAGLHEMHRTLGRLPWERLLAPAIELAEGHLVDSARHESLARADRLRRFPASRAQFLPGDSAPAPGAVWRQPELAATLRLIARDGPDAFYRGAIADLIVAEMVRGGGLITKADLAAYRPIWREPVTLFYRGHTIYSMPPSSSGGVTLGIILNVMGGYDRLPPFGGAELLHLEVEAMRRAFVDRNRLLGDPAFVDMPLERLLSKEYAAELRQQISRDRATPTRAITPLPREGASTTHYSIVDAEGNAAAVTTTLNSGFGSGVTVGGAGFLLNNEMDDFTSAPGRPNLYGLVQGEANAVAPGKRMLSAMTPTIVLDPAGELLLVLGSPGGPTIITTVYHVLSNVIDHGMPLAEAVAAPRVHHQALPDTVRYEPDGLAVDTRARLSRLGHALRARGMSGEVNAIQRAPAGGWIGVADPRRGGSAVGY